MNEFPLRFFPRPTTAAWRLGTALLAASAGFSSLHAAAAPKKPRPSVQTPWAGWVEPDFPFFSTVLDARNAGPGLPTNNLTPRGLVLNLGHDCWVTFDTDLLRVAGIWRGKGVTDKALAPGSYHDPSRKSPGGQFPAPEMDGKVWLTNGIYPGWQTSPQLTLEDPREPAPSPEEVGRGPLSEEMGRLTALRLVRGGVILEYTAGGAKIREWITRSEAAGQPVVERHLHVGPSAQPLRLVLGLKAKDTAVSLGLTAGQNVAQIGEEKSVWIVNVPAHPGPVEFCVAHTDGAAAPIVAPRSLPTEPAAPRWPQEVVTQYRLSTAKDAYVVDEIALPLDNPWRRDVRMGDIQFLKDGTGVGVTLDGDVWLIRGLGDPSGTVRWRRFASGLHEPMTVAIRDEQIYAFDRNGIWRLRDTNGDGEADVHELFSNAFAQTADMREFPASLRLAPGGEFVIAKGGQQSTTLGKHNGSILRISADGRRATVLGYGFRQPSMGVNVRTGLVIASDQQGQYIPSTPLHIVRDAQFYGFLSPKLPKEVYPAPIADPLTWIPHPVDASGISLIWLFGARMGPLNDSIVHVDFRKPQVFRVLMNERGAKPQAAVVSITQAFEFPPLNGAVSPTDGQLYLAGYQILGWGTSVSRLSGFGRVRYTGAPVTLPREISPMDKGVLLRFDVALDPKKVSDPGNYSLGSWQYKRTFNYGSPQLKADGAPGQDTLTASAAYLSLDGRSVFIAVPDMKPVMQLRVGWSLATADGVKFEENAYTTPYDLPTFNPTAEGFGDITVDLKPRAVLAQASGPVNIEEGQRVYQLFGCVACHMAEGADIPKIGPTWKGLYGRERAIFAGPGKTTLALADEAYLRESILAPTAKFAAGYEKGDAGMPSYAGVLTDAQIDSLILYIKSLK
jgi:mono/diheme cytochrome c family protein